MSFPQPVVERLLVATHRHCAICHKPAGIKIEIHHIIPKSEGGADTEENGIPLCFDCHADVAAYDPRHPKGRRFTPSELRKHRDQWFAICAQAPWQTSLAPEVPPPQPPVVVDDNVISALRVDDRKPTQVLVGTVVQLDNVARVGLAQLAFHLLDHEDDEMRWKAASVVEELVLWEPDLVPPPILEKMSLDPMFAVRSSAAVCYYYLAALLPASVPLAVLRRLAAFDEDWYVTTPATAALLRIARARPVAVDILAAGVDDERAQCREHSAVAIRRLAQRDPDLLPDELIAQMMQSADPFVRQAGRQCQKHAAGERKEPGRDYSLF